MKPPGGLGFLSCLVLIVVPVGAKASAWNQPRGEGQAIFKLESIRADRAYDQAGQAYDLLGGRRDGVASVLVEYGLTDRLTLQAKGEWQSGRDGAQDFEGRGPVEIGARWQVYQDRANVVSIYGGYSQSGQTRNAGYAEPGQGDRDVEVRLSLGRGGRTMFGEVEVARRMRQGLADETRLDLTLGRHLSSQWMVMGQMFMGATDRSDTGGRAQWQVAEASVVRSKGPWSGQLAWRMTLGGQSTPKASGPVLAIWRRF